MPIGTNSQILTFLVDTGAQRSFISRKQYEEKLERHTPYEETNVRMYGIGGAEMNIKGQIEVPVHVGGEMLYHKFLIADIEEEAIMGFDFMKKHKVEWTWADQTLQICQSKIPCDMDPESTPRRVARISTKTSMIIPPRSEVIIIGIVHYFIPNGLQWSPVALHSQGEEAFPIEHLLEHRVFYPVINSDHAGKASSH